MILSEGLKKGDLENLILPLLSIDEYESKIDDDTSIVVGFYVFEEDAAHDLSNFVERSPYMILNTDVSPAPTKDGYYMTFVEIQRNPEFPKCLDELLDEITLLCRTENWQFTSPRLKDDKIVDLNEENLKKYVDTEVHNPKYKSLKECHNFFANSTLTDVVLEANSIHLTKYNVHYNFKLVELTPYPPTGGFNLDESTASACLVLEKLLGGPYSVHSLDGNIVIENIATEQYMILGKI